MHMKTSMPDLMSSYKRAILAPYLPSPITPNPTIDGCNTDIFGLFFIAVETLFNGCCRNFPQQRIAKRVGTTTHACAYLFSLIVSVILIIHSPDKHVHHHPILLHLCRYEDRFKKHYIGENYKSPGYVCFDGCSITQ